MKTRMRLSKESLIITGLCLADLISTVVLVRRYGAVEANMVMRFYLQHGMAAFTAAKCLLFVPSLLIAEWYRRHNPRLITSTLRLVILLYIGFYSVGVFAINRHSYLKQQRELESLGFPVDAPRFEVQRSGFGG